MRALAWLVLVLVFVDEVLCLVAFGVVGWALPAPWLFVWLLPLLAMTAWFLFASPKAAFGGAVVRPVVKVLVFGLGTAGLWAIGHPDWALTLLAFSAVVNGLAQLRFVREALAAAGG